ncbi:MAG: hypothetical protein COV74_03595 [Candidatus Omnitrophica bacterium CG11_big_fil_rev_8_21_14_0_20_45_26]|uniref:GIY-YIG domain-containing protein n=1 Tax=Candidatus Abzuiibacterium crystallinum TaxID=1974748 RepID=A0A2H0LQP2_9BACT|nr:MAG: hypothetical protein COV74_03595 [Candidatus Omnitrophica bacterium CG11_big_fil_rev_8_21_14_0_20_45_26]PIW63338.1 MAG: hypothetical protein COW12_10765 [Candidatus Omnitrophica bacterium CG12_big_fil_rev_8_21_14_0_65_45_16]
MRSVYILKCSDGSFYVGTTNNLNRRFKEHCTRSGSVHTRKQISVELVYHETFKIESQALEREHQLKGWSRNKKLALINFNKAELVELSRSRD